MPGAASFLEAILSMSMAHRFYQLLWRHTWLDVKYKRAIYKKLCRYGEVPDHPFNKEFFGLRYQGNLNNSIEFSIFYFGAFEKPLLYFLGDTICNIKQQHTGDNRNAEGLRSCFCDIGANIGQHSLFVSRLVDQVHAFEPFDDVSARLEDHIALNQISNIKLHKIGLSDKTEQLTFYAPTGRNKGIGSFDASTREKSTVATGELSLVRGDEYFERNNILPVTLMKIDVEGFEKKVLSGLQQTITTQRPIIICEVS
jgi:FkbM family methyltransferase